MKRVAALCCTAVLALTACTDQPLPTEPTETVTSTPETTETAMTDEALAANIADVLEHPDPDEFSTGEAAIQSFTTLLLPETDDENDVCPLEDHTSPQMAAFGQVTEQQDDGEDASQSLGAVGFSTSDEAQIFTTQLQGFVADCDVLETSFEPLTHHTDEAFEVQLERTDETASSMVILRDENLVFVASSSPPTDVALSLTLADQLHEMLR